MFLRIVVGVGGVLCCALSRRGTVAMTFVHCVGVLACYGHVGGEVGRGGPACRAVPRAWNVGDAVVPGWRYCARGEPVPSVWVLVCAVGDGQVVCEVLEVPGWRLMSCVPAHPC